MMTITVLIKLKNYPKLKRLKKEKIKIVGKRRIRSKKKISHHRRKRVRIRIKRRKVKKMLLMNRVTSETQSSLHLQTTSPYPNLQIKDV